MKPNVIKNTCVALGDFDGIHKGHKDLIDRLIDMGNAKGLSPVVVSIYNSNEFVITTEKEKEILLMDIGINRLISIENKVYNKDNWEKFVKKTLIRDLGVKAVVVTNEFSKNQPMCYKILQNLCNENNCEVNIYTVDNTINSNSIKKALESNIEKANEMLGHPYIFHGKVISGKRLGRTVGMPTANLKIPNNKVEIKNGVYGSLVLIDGKKYIGVTNVGRRPSVDNFNYITVETFISDFHKIIYGKKITLLLKFYIRDVIKFDNLEQVKKQVEKDVLIVKEKISTEE